MKTLGERIKEERKKRKWSQADLAGKIDATQAAVSEIERDIPRSSGLVIPIARAFKVDVSYLTDGRERITSQMPSITDCVIVGGKNAGQSPDPSEYVMIPCYDVQGSCGVGIDVNEVNIIDGMPFPISVLRANKLPDPHYLAVIEASGESMMNTIENGELMIVNTLDVEPKTSKIYLICLDEKLFVKRLIYTPDGWIMRSDNPDKSLYPDFVLSPDKFTSLDIQGRVVWRGGMMS